MDMSLADVRRQRLGRAWLAVSTNVIVRFKAVAICLCDACGVNSAAYAVGGSGSVLELGRENDSD